MHQADKGQGGGQQAHVFCLLRQLTAPEFANFAAEPPLLSTHSRPLPGARAFYPHS
jgi:hypothetical protein